MSSELYLERTLFADKEESYSEDELIAASRCIIVIAEPGAGKTALLNSLAIKLNTSLVTASKFTYMQKRQANIPYVIDGFDELAAREDNGIDRLLGSLAGASPTQVIISSRSSEWDNASTHKVHEYLECEPLVVRMCEFSGLEQQIIFENYVSNEDFAKFHIEVSKFDLEALLPNPQFLKLFADAYLEGDRIFTDRQSIFKLAVERLAKEVSPTSHRNSRRLTPEQKVNHSSEVFAKLLLSGAEGVSSSELEADRLYPLLTSLNNEPSVFNILATRLFKPGESTDKHRPVHKIVAEYCAANFLIKRVLAPEDDLTMQACLSIIAPNKTVRDELRGLVGWLAALGNKDIQKELIQLDPYAVIANGDPSRLVPSAKGFLLKELEKVQENDPLFRRSDSWRKFSSAGFFTIDVVDDVKALLNNKANGELRLLILELLNESQGAHFFIEDLRKIVLDNLEDKSNRIYAMSSLIGCSEYMPNDDLEKLLAQGEAGSLAVAAKAMHERGLNLFKISFLELFFRACSELYPSSKGSPDTDITERFFIKPLVKRLDKENIEQLLDRLTLNLTCSCGLLPYECTCLHGTSNIVGYMLDKYFRTTAPPYEPVRVWGWIKNLKFECQPGPDNNESVKALYNHTELREGILTHVFGSLTDFHKINEARIHLSELSSHAGLRLTIEDKWFLVDLAYETDNIVLWSSFFARHKFYRRNQKEPDLLRRHMRSQAQGKPIFMREWANINRVSWKEIRGIKKRIKTRPPRRRPSGITSNEENIRYIQDNRAVIESGRHKQSLRFFARYVLNKPEEILSKFGDEELVKTALRNCLNTIEPSFPNLQGLATLQCSKGRSDDEMILFAACLEIMRKHKSLSKVERKLLLALKTRLQPYYSAIDEAELSLLKEEVDRLVLSDTASTEKFLREYVETQLATVECSYPNIDLLETDEVFRPLVPKITIEWLERFNELNLSDTSRLFELAAQFGDREKLNAIIKLRCSNILSKFSRTTENEEVDKYRQFWFVRAFYFLDLVDGRPYFECLKEKKESLLLFEKHSSRLSINNVPYWPKLTPLKVESILKAFFVQWPKVKLPNMWGSCSPKEEIAYRFLTNIIWQIRSGDFGEAIAALERLISDPRFENIHNGLKSIKAEHIRNKALANYEPPSPEEITDYLDNNIIVSVEGLRTLLIQKLSEYQKEIAGGEFNAGTRFYTKDVAGQPVHLDEVSCVELIAERLSLQLTLQNITIDTEDQTKNQNRIDITAAKTINGRRRLLVIEAKGQWHRDLYEAAYAQLYQRYSIHPDAEKQGVYLVIWFGVNVEVAGRKSHEISSAQELKASIEARLPSELIGLIDVFVLDVSL